MRNGDTSEGRQCARQILLRCRHEPERPPLTDEQQAAIAWADPGESHTALGRRLGVPAITVYAMRSRLARAGGWWCELVVLTCLECGQPLLTNPKGAFLRRRHAACQRVHHEQVTGMHAERRTQQRREERAARPPRERVVPAPIDAFRKDKKWSPEEDARLLVEPTVSAPVLARELGRSANSVRMRRMRVRRHFETHDAQQTST